MGALLVHVVSLAVLSPWISPPDARSLRVPPTRLLVIQPEEVRPEEPPEVPTPELDGQLVELPKPLDPQRPEDAEYLSEYDVTVEEETRSERFEINPEVLANQWSRDQKMQREEAEDVNADKPSTGAKVGNDRFDPERDGNLSALPSPWAKTNKDGLQDPVPSSHASESMSGSPNNDLVDERIGDALALNSKEYLYAGYLQRIRRLVNFYWNQNLENLPASTRLAKSSYLTVVEVVLDDRGGLEVVAVTREAGVEALDGCVVRAFHLAGPFPNPPEGLVSQDGRVYLPTMGFTVQQGVAQMRYQGVDPRAGVQFPGLLKSPR